MLIQCNFFVKSNAVKQFIFDLLITTNLHIDLFFFIISLYKRLFCYFYNIY